MKTRILQIEDNEQNRYLVSFLLSKAGHQILNASDGPSALQMLKTETVDLIILDIQLPDMDGYETARRIRGTTGLDRIPLVAVTSYAMAEDQKRAVQAGFAAYIEKPIEPATFVQTIERLLPTK